MRDVITVLFPEELLLDVARAGIADVEVVISVPNVNGPENVLDELETGTLVLVLVLELVLRFVVLEMLVLVVLEMVDADTAVDVAGG